MNANNNTVIESCWILSGVFFILSLGGLSNQVTSRKGNLFGMFGMVLAIAITLFSGYMNNMAVAKFFLAIAAGAIIGIFLALMIDMIRMPQLVAMLHSFVGIAAVLVGYSNYLATDAVKQALGIAHDIEIYAGIFIGTVTFIGSIVAFLKLEGLIRSEPLIILGWGRHAINAIIMITVIILGVLFVATQNLIYLIVMTTLALIIGWHLVLILLFTLYN